MEKGRQYDRCRAVFTSHCSFSDSDVSPITSASFAFEQLLSQRPLQPAALSLSSWHASHSVIPDSTFARHAPQTRILNLSCLLILTYFAVLCWLLCCTSQESPHTKE
jgi:hypothetical protein